MKRIILQAIGNFIIKMIESCPKSQVNYWHNMGLKLNEYALFKDIELK